MVPPIVHEVLRSPGKPLDPATRAFMEPRFGHDFSSVRVHTDARAAESARAVNALAYTVGRDVVVGNGQHTPSTKEGLGLMAHELTHVMQQSAVGVSAPNGVEMGATDSSSEREADQVANRIVSFRGPQSVVVSPANHSLQRACGPVAIGAPRGCTGFGGDVNGEPFLFLPNCDEFRHPPDIVGDEEARLRAFASTLSPDDTISIHGFASIEGDPTFNDNLSCARALAALSVIRSVAPLVNALLFMHGATPGDPDERRSVIIDRNPAPTPINPEPPVKPPENQDICGPDITDPLIAVLADVRSTFGGWSPTQKREACDAITGVTTFVMAWDIHDLFLPETDWLRLSPFHPPCGMPGATGSDIEDSATCSNSVQVRDKCFLAGTVNYALFGQICRLCNDEFGSLSEQTMIDLIGLWKLLTFITFDDPGPPTAWARAGFHGFPGSIPTQENRAHCTGRCLVPYTRGPFTWVWEPHHPR